MLTGDGTEPIADDEIVYRRVSMQSGWYDPTSDQPVAWNAFKPNKNDADGISVWRAKYKSASNAAAIAARPDRRYYVLVLRAGDLRKAGIEFKASPEHGGVGHASLRNLNTGAYKEDRNAVRALANLIAAELVDSIEGPFGPFNAE